MVATLPPYLYYQVSRKAWYLARCCLSTASYINDVATAISSDSDAADDIALYHVIRTRTDYTNVPEDVNSVSTCIGQKISLQH